MKSKIVTMFLITLGMNVYSRAQNIKRAAFIGLNPSVTVEPFYEKGELDVNIFPLIYQKTLSRRTDIRVSSILNFGVRNMENEISHYGAQISFPMYFKKKELLSSPSESFYIAPGIGCTRNRIELHTNFGFWAEPGYHLKITEKWTISFGVQLGATHFSYDDNTQKWGNHFGIKIIIGRWLGKNTPLP